MTVLPLTLLAPDLTKNPPRDPYQMLGRYNILPRTLDKCRAQLCNTAAGYNYKCDLDDVFFEFTNICPEEFKAYVALGEDDLAVLAWVQLKTSHLSEQQILAWSYENREACPVDEEERSLYESKRLEKCPDKLYILTWFELVVAMDEAKYS